MTKTVPLSDDAALPIIDGTIDLYDALTGVYDIDTVGPNDFDRLWELFDEMCREYGFHPDDDMEKALNQLYLCIESGER